MAYIIIAQKERNTMQQKNDYKTVRISPKSHQQLSLICAVVQNTQKDFLEQLIQKAFTQHQEKIQQVVTPAVD